ncbi:MAG: hypothetical protein WA421_05625 [Nitrososphaeraceae archaeon]|jgi:hypothetical protein
MPSKLPDSVKLLVVQQWLTGAQRDKIAADNGLSVGAVTKSQRMETCIRFFCSRRIKGAGCYIKENWYICCSMCSRFQNCNDDE